MEDKYPLIKCIHLIPREYCFVQHRYLVIVVYCFDIYENQITHILFRTKDELIHFMSNNLQYEVLDFDIINYVFDFNLTDFIVKRLNDLQCKRLNKNLV